MDTPIHPWLHQHRANPQALYRQMRATGPLYPTRGPQTGNNIWFVVGYAEAVAILRDDDRFGKNHDRLPPNTAALYGETLSQFRMMDNNMLFMDPPDHSRLRALVHKVFTPKRIEGLRGWVAQMADSYLDAIAGNTVGGDTVDLITDFAFPVPITVIAELLGVPPADRDQFRAWTKELLFGSNLETATIAALAFMSYFHEMFDDRKAHPKDDLISDLVAVEEAGDRLTREELMGMVFLLLTAGHETTVNLIGNGMLALMQHPQAYADLVAAPDLLPTAIEEMLRYNGPVEVATTRWAFEDVTVGDVTIAAGDAVLVSLIGANHDPAVFADPDVFDIRRTPNKHLAFGHGIHYCLGAPLARLEGTVALGALIQRYPNLELATDVAALEWNDSTLLHGMKALPVRLRP